MWERCLLAATNVRKKYNLKQGDRVILAAAANIDFIYAYFLNKIIDQAGRIALKI